MNDENDQFDSLLADYFDWADTSHGISIGAFVVAYPRWRSEPRLLEQLEQFVANNQDLEDVASSTVVHWLGMSGNNSIRFSGETGSWKSTPGGTFPRSAAAIEKLKQLANYELACEVGRGGMGVVYRARHTQLQKNVCIKLMLQGALANERDVERFWAEARAMAALRHPNIVAVHDVGQDEDQCFFVMDEITGQTLAQRVAENSMSDQAAAKTVLAIADAVSYAHGQGVLHRDLKPANILLDSAGVPYVSDFGLARQIDADSLTTARGLVGTPAYIAPEITVGQAATPATDIYGLGTVLFEALTGRPPYQGITPLDTLMQVRRNETPIPSAIRASVSRDLETICMTCMATLPSERYSTATDVAAELGRFLRGEPIQARRLSFPVRAIRWMRRYPLIVALATTVLAASVTVAAVQWHSNHVTTNALNELSEAHSGLQSATSVNERLIKRLKRERETLEQHLYLSDIGRSQQAIQHGNIAEAEMMLDGLVPPKSSADSIDRRDWEWHFLRNQTSRFTHSFESEDGVVFQALAALDANKEDLARSKIIMLSAKQLLHWSPAAGKVLSEQRLQNTASRIAWHENGQQIAIAMSNGVRISGPAGERTIVTDANRSVRCMAWNRSGSELAIGFDDSRIAIAHMDDARPRWIDSGSTDGINGISWNSADRVLAVGSDDGSVHLLDASNTSVQPRHVATFSDWVNDVAFAPSANRLTAITNDGQLVIWSVSSSASNTIEITEQQSHRSPSGAAFTSLAWHPKGTMMAIGLSNGVIRIWEMDSARFTRSLFGHHDLIESLDWTDRSQLVSSSRDGTVKTWDVERPSAGQRLNRGETPVRHAVWNSVGSRLAWRDVEGTTIIWNRETQSMEDEFFESDAGATALAWHPKSDHIAFAREGTVLLFEIGAITGPEEFRTDGTVWTTQFSPTGQLIATAGAGKSIEVWDIRTGAKVSALDHGESVRALCWTSPNEICSIDQLATLRRWNLKGELAEHVASIRLPTDFATAIAVNPAQTRLAVSSQEGPIHLVDLKSFAVSGRLTGHQDTSWSVAFSENGNRLFSGGQDGTLRIWDLKTLSQALQIQAHDTAVWSVALHEKQLVTTGADGAVRLWNGDAKP